MQRRGAKWSDVVAGAFALMMIGTFALAQAMNMNETANRVKCASNLRQIGQAILLYSNDNRGVYPRTTADHQNPTPTWGTPYEGSQLGAVDAQAADPFDAKVSKALPKANDVTAALFLLLRTQDITSEVFVCASTGNEKFDFGGGTNASINWTNWQGNKGLAEHLSYSYQNPYPSVAAIGAGWKLNNAIGAEYAVAADMNPGVDALKTVKVDAPFAEMKKINSANHAGDGQNVLYGDGHVAFESSPYVGVMRDNVYTFGNSGSDKFKDKTGDGIVGAPVGPDDSILLPTAKDLGVVDAQGTLSDAAKKRREGVSPDMKPGTPQEQAAAQQKFLGNYVGEQGGQKIKLLITGDKIVGTSGPVSITFSYKVAGLGKDVTRLELSAPETAPSHASITVQPDGILIKGNQFFEGTWKKQ